MPSIFNTCKKKAWRLHFIATVDQKRQGACRANDIILSHWNHTSHIWLKSADQHHTLQAQQTYYVYYQHIQTQAVCGTMCIYHMK